MVQQTKLASIALGVILWCPEAFADGALAVGLPDGKPENGFVWGGSTGRTPAEARSEALGTCRGMDIRNTSKARRACRIVETFRNECLSVAMNGDRETPASAVGWAIGPNKEIANKRALAMCETNRRNAGRACHLDLEEAVCDGTAE